MKSILLLSVAIISLASQAEALTVTTTQTLPSFASIITPNPSAVTPSASFFGTSTANVFDGSTLIARSPFESVSGYMNAPFDYVLGGGSATFTAASNPAFVTGGNTFSFIFGSPDEYNTISFFDGITPVGFITGSDSAFTGTPGLGYYVTTVSGISAYDSVKFSSTKNSIEFATYNVSSVPLPASFPLFGAAILGLGAFAFMKKRGARAASSA